MLTAPQADQYVPNTHVQAWIAASVSEASEGAAVWISLEEKIYISLLNIKSANQQISELQFISYNK